jgi:amidohydrolase
MAGKMVNTEKTGPMGGQLADAVRELMPEIIELRRHLHKHPELSGHEENTAAYVADLLEGRGIAVRRGIGGHGLLAKILAKHEDGWIALRADMDALPIQDKKQTSYASGVPGVCHACGHDAHTAMLAGAALVLSRFPQLLAGNIACIFQPAEETTEGAAAMLANGVFDDFLPRRIHALHTYPYLPSGSLGLREGPMCAAAEMFEVEIVGRGGHAARPHECIDVILIASQIIHSLHHIVSRRVNPLHPAVISIGQIEGGKATNVIPESVRFSGTVRSLYPETHEEIRTRMDRIIRQTAETWGAVAYFSMRQATPVLINDPGVMRKVRRRLRRFMPHVPTVEIDEPSMGGEDFAEFLSRIPGCLLRLGTGSNPATRYPLHHSCFDIDEQAMETGILALVSLCVSE